MTGQNKNVRKRKADFLFDFGFRLFSCQPQDIGYTTRISTGQALVTNEIPCGLWLLIGDSRKLGEGINNNNIPYLGDVRR